MPKPGGNFVSQYPRPQRSGHLRNSLCRETDCKHKVGSDRQEVLTVLPVMKHLRMLGIRLAWNGDAISELQWYQF